MGRDLGQETARLNGLDDDYFVPAFSSDGRRLVTTSTGGGDNDDRITVWDLTTGAESLTFQTKGKVPGRSSLPTTRSSPSPRPPANVSGIYSITDGTLLRSIATPGFEAARP